MTDTKVVLLYESTAQHLAQTVASAAIAVGMCWMGLTFNSTAMQWIGFAFFWLTIIAAGKSTYNKSTKTPQEAADWLYATFGVTARAEGR